MGLQCLKKTVNTLSVFAISELVIISCLWLKACRESLRALRVHVALERKEKKNTGLQMPVRFFMLFDRRL